MTQDEKKIAVARAAMGLVERGTVIGVGTGSTANHFIDALAAMASALDGAVSSSDATTTRLNANGVRVLELNDVGRIPLYIDGADEADDRRRLIKGGGGALTREKIVAAASDRFVCIIDESKRVDRLGAFPLPIEVVPMARVSVSRQLEALGGRPVWREGIVTDGGNVILDVHGLMIENPPALEATIDGIAGVVTNGLFCRRPADLLMVGTDNGVEEV